jgi:hypothetical protein
VALGVDRELGVSVCLGSFAADFSPIARSGRSGELSAFFAFVSDPGFEFEAVSGSTLASIALVPFVMHQNEDRLSAPSSKPASLEASHLARRRRVYQADHPSHHWIVAKTLGVVEVRTAVRTSRSVSTSLYPTSAEAPVNQPPSRSGEMTRSTFCFLNHERSKSPRLCEAQAWSAGSVL